MGIGKDTCVSYLGFDIMLENMTDGFSIHHTINLVY